MTKFESKLEVMVDPPMELPIWSFELNSFKSKFNIILNYGVLLIYGISIGFIMIEMAFKEDTLNLRNVFVHILRSKEF